MNKIVGLPTSFLLSCFISGLSPKIRCEVLALQPLSLVQAAALARLQEDKILDAPRSSRSRPHTLTPASPSPLPSSPLLPLFPASPKTTYKRLTQAEMASRSGRYLFYNCDERYGPNHHFRAKFFLLVASEDDDKPLFDPP